MRRNTVITSIQFVAAVLVSFCLGCAVANYGGINPDAGAERDFEAMQMDPRMNYYYSGPDALPNAMVALKNEYLIGPDLWKPVENEKAYAEQIKSMQAKALDLGTRIRGFIIQDDKGNTLGMWYSLLHARTFVKMGENNEVIIKTPDLIIYEQQERDNVRPPRIR
jgi:hypothetical protein